MSSPKSANKSKSLGASVLALVAAGLYFLAQQMGLLSSSDSDSGGGASGGSTVVVEQSANSEGATGHAGGNLSVDVNDLGGAASGPSTDSAASASAQPEVDDNPNRPSTAPPFDAALGLKKVANAYENNLSDVILGVEGEVVHLLPDDNHGSRHQLFLLELANDITLKISHNIDQAPYIPLERGDRVSVFGEYEWNDKGGVLHWTHLAHGGSHPDGYIEHEGRFYQ